MSEQTPQPLGGDEPAPLMGDTAPDAGLVTPGQGAGFHGLGGKGSASYQNPPETTYVGNHAHQHAGSWQT